MLAMLPRGMEPFLSAICKRGSCLSPSAGRFHHYDVVAWSLGEVSYFDGSMGWFGRPETKRKKMRISGGLTTLHFQAA
jgi:hypothetical protein